MKGLILLQHLHGAIVNIIIFFKIILRKNYNISSYPTPENCLFRAVSLTKHVDTDQYKYSRYGIGFDRKEEFSFGNGFGRNVIILGIDMSLMYMLITIKKML